MYLYLPWINYKKAMKLKNIINAKAVVFFSLLLILIDIVVISLSYNKLPEQIPSHYDSDFNPTDYAGKIFMFGLWGIHVFIVFLLNVAFFVVKKFFPAIVYLIGLIVFAQLCMILIDTVRTILLSIHPRQKHDLSWVEYLILSFTLLLSIVFIIKARSNEK